MKVKISYTIDFDELPTKVQGLLDDTINELTSRAVAIQVHASDMDTSESKMDMISKLQTFRQSLMKYDMQLADYVNLLANYEKARLEVMTDEEDTQSTERDNESG
tara:strand:+ start:478 stop:792 length:315 start_codon:yes stop_codon:yes gene_type:complete